MKFWNYIFKFRCPQNIRNPFISHFLANHLKMLFEMRKNTAEQCFNTPQNKKMQAQTDVQHLQINVTGVLRIVLIVSSIIKQSSLKIQILGIHLKQERSKNHVSTPNVKTGSCLCLEQM